MKIGILDADHLSPAVINKYGCYADKFVELLSPIQSDHNIKLTFKRYNVLDFEYPQSIEECDCYIITGSQYSVYEVLDWIKKLQEFTLEIIEKKQKLIGICFGHQIIAQCLGGKVEKNTKGWELGITATHITESREWMQPQRDFFFTLVTHQDHVTKLPDGAINFAETNLSPFSGFTIDNHVLTLQGHPEFSKEYVKLIIRLQSKNLSSEQIKSAKASLLQNDDHVLVREWLFHFINS